MPGPLLLIEQTTESLTTLTLNRPEKRNALSVALVEALREAVIGAQQDARRRVLILRGAGPAFCAGLDLAEAASPENAHRSATALAGLYAALATSPLVTVAAAQGAALGGGAGLLLACDFVVASRDLTIGFPEVRRGLVAALVSCLLRRQVGERDVRALILLARSVSAEQGKALGLIHEIVGGADGLALASRTLADEICRGAPGAIARTKRLLNELAPRTIAEDLEIAMRYHLEARESAEAAEGIAAFREKREPRWG